jgi:prepilin-type N-terminal cleavage/methylation domain-containing protein
VNFVTTVITYNGSMHIVSPCLRPRPTRAGGRHQGFTLIELLVVIAIIAVITGLLMPAIGMVRASASSVRCLGSQRQVALGCIAYSVDNKGCLPSLRARGSTPTQIATLWTNLILENYLETGEGVEKHTNLSRTVLQGCREWKRATAEIPSAGGKGYVSHDWQSAYGMNKYPFFDIDKFNFIRHSDYASDPNVSGQTKGGFIYLRQITKINTRLLLGDALNTDMSSTYLVQPTNRPVTEDNNKNGTNLKSWHRAGKQVVISMFDGHSEKRSLTDAAAAMSAP